MYITFTNVVVPCAWMVMLAWPDHLVVQLRQSSTSTRPAVSLMHRYILFDFLQYKTCRSVCCVAIELLHIRCATKPLLLLAVNFCIRQA